MPLSVSPVYLVRCFCGQLLKVVDKRIRLQTAMKVFIDQGAGCLFAGTEAFNFKQGDLVVFGGFTGINSEHLADLFHDIRVAAKLAGNGSTDIHHIFAGRGQAEFFVERYGVLNLGAGNFQKFRSFINSLFRDIAVFMHNDMKQVGQTPTEFRKANRPFGR